MNVAEKLLAQVPTPLGTIGGGPGFGPYDFTNVTSTITGPVDIAARIVSFVIGIMTLGAGIYFIFQLLTAGMEWMTASSDKGKLSKAQERLTHAFTGLIIVVAVFAIAALMQELLGVDFLLKGPEVLIQQLKLGT